MLATLRADPTTSEEEYFRLALVQTEMERAKFLVRSYVRTRLHKVGTSRASVDGEYADADMDVDNPAERIISSCSRSHRPY